MDEIFKAIYRGGYQTSKLVMIGVLIILAVAILTPPIAYAISKGMPLLFGWWWNFWLQG